MTCNIITEYVNFSRNCLKKYSNRIMGAKYNSDICDRFCNAYIEVRFYNNSEKTGQGFYYDIGLALRNEASALVKEGFSKENIEPWFKMYKFLIYFDGACECESVKDLLKELETFRQQKITDEKDEKFVGEMFEMVKEDLITKKEYVEKFYTENFVVDFYLTNKKTVYDSVISHNLKFPKLYDKKAVKKVFNSKEILEDRPLIKYSYVAVTVLKDIIKGNFENEYLIEFPDSVNKKETKKRNLLNIIDNDIAKEKIIIKINFGDFLKSKDFYYPSMRMGFRFAVIIDDKFVYSEENEKLLEVFKYVITSPKVESYDKLKEKFDLIILR